MITLTYNSDFVFLTFQILVKCQENILFMMRMLHFFRTLHELTENCILQCCAKYMVSLRYLLFL